MPVSTPAELLAFLQKHGFLTPPQVQKLGGSSATKFADVRVLARELVDRNWLTPYQANQVLMGCGGDLLLGSCRILDRLGEGGRGQVFKGYHVSMDRIIALKVIPRDRVSDLTAVARFSREVRAVAKLSHPNIVIAFEANQVGQTPYLAMEYVDGIDLARLVQQSGPLPILRACDYIRQTAKGLQHAHEKGLVHRDIKPGNLMVARPNPDEPPLIKILDFGLARFESESDHTTRLTQLGKVVGTVDYIAPEQAYNARTADIRADIYSLGCTLFYLLTGKPPFQGQDTLERIRARALEDVPSVRKYRPEVSSALERVLAKMMAHNPADRYQTPGEVVKALEPHTQQKRPAAAAAFAQTVTPSTPETKFATLQLGDERKYKRQIPAVVWIGLTGAVALTVVALLGILSCGIVLVAFMGISDSEDGTPATTVTQRTSNDLKPRAATRAKKENPVKAGQDLLVNGSFEEGPAIGATGFITLRQGSTAIKGWTVTQGEIDYMGFLWEHADGERSLDLQGRIGFVGGIEQTFATVKGRRYRVTFSLAGNPENRPIEKKMEVRAAGVTTIVTFDITGKSHKNMGWVTKTWEFTAIADKTTLEFFAPNAAPNGWGPALDNVSVTAVDE